MSALDLVFALVGPLRLRHYPPCACGMSTRCGARLHTRVQQPHPCPAPPPCLLPVPTVV